MVRTSSSTSTSTFFSSRPGSSAEMRTSFSDWTTSMLGQAGIRPSREGVLLEHVIEEPVHLAVKSQEGADLPTTPAGDGRLIATPGDQITRSHDVLHWPVLNVHHHPRARARGVSCLPQIRLSGLGLLDLGLALMLNGLIPSLIDQNR